VEFWRCEAFRTGYLTNIELDAESEADMVSFEFLLLVAPEHRDGNMIPAHHPESTLLPNVNLVHTVYIE